MKEGWATRTSPTAMRRQRQTERRVRLRLLTSLSMKTLKTGDVKLMTMRSPIGIRGMAVRTARLEVDRENP